MDELFDRSKSDALIDAIEQADIPDDIKEFLQVASYRHIRFNFSKIADFYAHADAEIQNLMEESALVIIDYQKAIELGFVRLTGRLLELEKQDYENR